MEYHHPVRVFLRGLKVRRREWQRVCFHYLFKLVPVSSRRLGPPRGQCEDLPRYVAERQNLPDPGSRPAYREIHPASRLDFATRPGFPAANGQPKGPIAADLPPAGLCVLPRARVYGRRLAVINADDEVIASLSREYGGDIRTHFVFSRPKLPKITRLPGTTCFLGCLSGNNYYHWVLDCLPILDVLNRGGFDPRQADHIVFTGIQQPFQQEMIKVLGLPLEKIVETDRIRHLETDRLVCSSTQILSGGLPRWACDFLRNELASHFLPQGRPGKRRRLYISREDAAYRRVRNQAEIEAVLQRHGFEKIVLTPLSVREQIAAFGAAEWVVAPHGAGLTNLVFSPPGTQVIELFAPEFQNPCYYELCVSAGHRYQFLLGESESSTGKAIPEMTRLDMTVSPSKLDALLQELPA